MVADIFTCKIIFYRFKEGFGFSDNAVHNKGTKDKWLKVGIQVSEIIISIFVYLGFISRKTISFTISSIRLSDMKLLFLWVTMVEYWSFIWFNITICCPGFQMAVVCKAFQILHYWPKSRFFPRVFGIWN